MSMKVSLRTCVLEDTRKEPAVIRKIIQSPKSAGLNFESVISVSEPPVFDFTFTQAPEGDKCIDMLIEETRVNLSIPFFLQLTKYFVESLPTEQVDKGVVNEGYEGGNNHTDAIEKSKAKPQQLVIEPPNETEDQSGTSVSIRIRKPEILLFGDLKASNAHAILIQAELMIESSKHTGTSSIVCNLSNVCAKSKSQERFRRQPPQWVLRPCDIDICYKEKTNDDQGQIILDVSSVNVHLSAGTVCTLSQILRDASEIFRIIDAKFENRNDCPDVTGYADLWSPKKIFSTPCRMHENENWRTHSPPHFNDLDDTSSHLKVLNLKPFEIHVILEMEDTIERIPMVKAEIEVGASITSFNSTYKFDSSFKIHAFCYNSSRGSWEPFIELCTKDDVTYYPWELTIRIYQAESHELNSCINHSSSHLKNQMKKSTPKKKRLNNHNSSEDDQNNEDMLFIRPDATEMASKISVNEYSFEHDEDSDSNDDDCSEKLARSFSHLFTSNESDEDEDDTDSDTSSKCEDEGLELTPEHVSTKNKFSYDVRTSVGTINESPCLANYIIISAEERINFTITQNTITIIDIIMNIFSKNRTGIPIVPTNAGKLNLINEIGHPSVIELIAEEKGNDRVSRLIASKEFKPIDSPVSPPSSPESEFCMSEHFMESAFTDNADSTYTETLNDPVIFPDDSPMHIYNSMTEESLRIHIDGFEDTMIYCPKWHGHKLIPLRPSKSNITYHLIVEVTTDHHLHRTITVRSPLQIKNDTSYAIGIYYNKKLAEELNLHNVLNGEATNPFDDSMRITVIEPSETYNVPLYITHNFNLHLMPVNIEKFNVSNTGISWKDLTDNSPKDIFCTSDSGRLFGVKVHSSESLPLPRYQWSSNQQLPNYLISIVPPLIFDNKLPFVVDLHVPSIDYDVRIEPGQKINVYSINCNLDTTVNIKIQNYLKTQWSGTFKLTNDFDKRLIKMFADGETDALWRPINLSIELTKSTSWMVLIYSDYWIINKTGLTLKLQETLSNNIEINDEELIVFSQKKQRKKYVILKIQQSDWSQPFYLDSLNSTSLIICKDIERKRKYKLLCNITSSKLSPLYTKIITFLPYFFIKNNTKRALRFMEENDDADLWYDLSPNQGIPFWPLTDRMNMRVKWKNSQLVSQHFSLVNIGKIVLRMENGTGLCVDVKNGVKSTYLITFEKYYYGLAPVRIDNLCDDLFLKLHQVGLGQVALLSPFQSLLYTWDDPTVDKQLIWNVYNSKTKGYPAEFTGDGFGRETVTFRTIKKPQEIVYDKRPKKRVKKIKMSVSNDGSSSYSDTTDSEADYDEEKIEKIEKNKTVIYWVSYVDRKQRVLTFTQDEMVYLKLKSFVNSEFSKYDYYVGLAGVGVSIVADNLSTKLNNRELAYISITDSAAHWELDIGKKWKLLTIELNAWLEDKYKNSNGYAKLNNSIDVNFLKMHITKPFYGKLRRTYSPGLWLNVRKSNSLIYVQGHVHRVQIDNQKYDTIFPIILRSGGRKMFSNNCVSRFKHSVEFLVIRQRKLGSDYWKRINVLVREFHLNLQEEFFVELVNEMMPKKCNESKTSLASRLKSDLANVYVQFPGGQPGGNADFVESVYVAPIKVNVKLLASADGSLVNYDPMGYCHLFRQLFDYASKGTFLKQAEFKLPHYERSLVNVGVEELVRDVLKDYRDELRHQFNVSVQGMTVLGNPYSYNFKAPGDAFYDTEAIILHGDEVAEKLNWNISCLLGYSSMDGLIAPLISINNLEYENNRQKPKVSRFESTDTPLSALTLDRSYSIGVELEMSGLIVKPTDNTHQEELKYSLKELGKGILSLTKIEDGKSSLRIQPGLILDTIKRAQERGYNFVSRIRFPRYINPYSAVELYSMYKARGMYLLNTVTKNEYQNSETYWAHAALSSDGKHIALVSLQKIYLLEKRSSIWASWNVAWSIETKELTEAPTVAENKLILHVNKRLQNQLMSQSSPEWYMECNDVTTLEWLSKKINTAMILNMINSRCRTV